MTDDQIYVKISNDGPPISPEHMEKLFTPFFTTKGLGKGTGLGLSICKGILKRYNATITAANEPGRVTFEVRLPKVQTAPPEAAITNHALAGDLAAGGGSEGSPCRSETKST